MIFQDYINYRDKFHSGSSARKKCLMAIWVNTYTIASMYPVKYFRSTDGKDKFWIESVK